MYAWLYSNSFHKYVWVGSSFFPLDLLYHAGPWAVF